MIDTRVNAAVGNASEMIVGAFELRIQRKGEGNVLIFSFLGRNDR